MESANDNNFTTCFDTSKTESRSCLIRRRAYAEERQPAPQSVVVLTPFKNLHLNPASASGVHVFLEALFGNPQPESPRPLGEG